MSFSFFRIFYSWMHLCIGLEKIQNESILKIVEPWTKIKCISANVSSMNKNGFLVVFVLLCIWFSVWCMVNKCLSCMTNALSVLLITASDFSLCYLQPFLNLLFRTASFCCGIIYIHQMKKNIYHSVGRIPKYHTSRKIPQSKWSNVERDKTDTLNTTTLTLLTWYKHLNKKVAGLDSFYGIVLFVIILGNIHNI